MPLDKRGVVNITISDAPVRSLVESIVINGGYDFVTSGTVTETVNLSLAGASIEEALDTISQITGLEYRVDGRIITLYGRGVPTEYTKVHKLRVLPVAKALNYIRSLMEASPSAASASASGPSPLASLLPGGQSGPAEQPLPPGVIADYEHNQLIVTARPSIHRRIEHVMPIIDTERTAEPTTYHVFELKYISSALFKNVIKFQLPVFRDSQFLELAGDGTGSNQQQQQGGSSQGQGQQQQQGGSSNFQGGQQGSYGGSQQGQNGNGANSGANGTGAYNQGNRGGQSGGGGGGGGSPGANSGNGVSVGEVGTSNTRRVLISDTEKNLAIISGLLDKLDRPLKQIYAEINLMRVSQSDKSQNGVQLRGLVNQNGRTTPLSEFFSNLGNGTNSLSLRFGTLGPENFSILLDYLKARARAKTIANPKMLVQEGQEARINITQQFPVFETEVVQGVPVNHISFTDVGTILRFTPSVFADGTIRLAINPEISNVVRTISIGTNGEVPVKDSNIISTVLNVRSGDTAVIGGLKTQNIAHEVDSQPFLGRVPILGSLFRRNISNDDYTDLVFTLTPRIVEDGDELVAQGCHQHHNHCEEHIVVTETKPEPPPTMSKEERRLPYTPMSKEEGPKPAKIARPTTAPKVASAPRPAPLELGIPLIELADEPSIDKRASQAAQPQRKAVVSKPAAPAKVAVAEKTLASVVVISDSESPAPRASKAPMPSAPAVSRTTRVAETEPEHVAPLVAPRPIVEPLRHSTVRLLSAVRAHHANELAQDAEEIELFHSPFARPHASAPLTQATAIAPPLRAAPASRPGWL